MDKFNTTLFYIGQAISGTGQDDMNEIDVKKIEDYLNKFAIIVAGEAAKLWLQSLDLGTYEEIETAVIEYCEIYYGREVVT